MSRCRYADVFEPGQKVRLTSSFLEPEIPSGTTGVIGRKRWPARDAIVEHVRYEVFFGQSFGSADIIDHYLTEA